MRHSTPWDQHTCSNPPWALSQAAVLELALALATMEAEARKAEEAEEVEDEEAERPLQWKRAPQITAEAAVLAGALATSAEDLAHFQRRRHAGRRRGGGGGAKAGTAPCTQPTRG